MRKYIAIVLICSVMLSTVGANEKDGKCKTLEELKRDLRTGFLKSVRTKKMPDVQPIVPHMKRVVNGNSTSADIKAIEKHAQTWVKGKIWKVGNYGSAVYVFTGDLTLLWMYTKEVKRVPWILMEKYLIRQDNAVREALLKKYNGKKLADYLAQALTFNILRRSRLYFMGTEGHRARFRGDHAFFATSGANTQVPRILAMLPQSTKRNRLLVNYPFTVASGLWIIYAYPEKVKEAHKKMNLNWGDGPKPGRAFEWYYRKVIQEAGLEKEFMKQLELRNMTDVIPDKLKPQK